MYKTDEKNIRGHSEIYRRNPTTDDTDEDPYMVGYHSDMIYDDEIGDDMFC